MKHMKKNQKLDAHTKQYIKRVKWMQGIVLLVVALAFGTIAFTVVSNNKKNLEQVALDEVKESMQETVNNIIIHIDSARLRTENQAMVAITDLQTHIARNGFQSAEDLLNYMEVSKENRLGQVIELIFEEKNGQGYYINRYERSVFKIDGEKEGLYRNAGICTSFMVGDKEVILFIRQSELDKIVKEEIHEYLHSEVYSGNQYVWVNEVYNMDGGMNYAIRAIHPNLVESEGEYLSTYMTDAVGNYPYQTELEGIREEGYIFHSYYFKNKLNDEVTEKHSYAQYYEPYSWIVATGETIEEVYAYSEQVNKSSFYQIFVLMAMFAGLFVVTSGIMIRSLGNQSENFRKTLLKQAEVYEDMYTSMSTGLLRIFMTESQSRVLQINPTGLEALGVSSEEELAANMHGHIIETMLKEDAEKLEETCKGLNKQWESAVSECHVEWKDGSIRLIRIRDTVVDIESKGKTIQRMCQDITEERYQQEQAILAAEEKATLDPMTQIKNKKAIETVIRTQILEASQQLKSIAIGFVDIDNFRDYNTKYGHMQGDEVIKYVANTVKENVPGIAGRNGGDEFVFVIPDATYEIVENAMKIIHKKLNEGLLIKDIGEKVPTPCSIGVIIEKRKELDYDYVMEQSDVAMYEAKARGKNTYHILNHAE